MHTENKTITYVSAQGAAEQPSFGEAMMQMLPLMVFIFVIFYFVYQRPMLKEKNQHEQMIKGLIKGDAVLTIGGIHGVVAEIKDLVVVIKTGDKTRITISKSSIKAKLSREEEAAEAKA